MGSEHPWAPTSTRIRTLTARWDWQLHSMAAMLLAHSGSFFLFFFFFFFVGLCPKFGSSVSSRGMSV